MFASVAFTTIAENTIVKGIGQKQLVIGNRKRSAVAAREAKRVNLFLNEGEGVVGRSVELECRLNQRCFVRVNDDGFSVGVIEIANGSALGPDATFRLAA